MIVVAIVKDDEGIFTAEFKNDRSESCRKRTKRRGRGEMNG
jgi:hypothetical protein